MVHGLLKGVVVDAVECQCAGSYMKLWIGRLALGDRDEGQAAVSGGKLT